MKKINYAGRFGKISFLIINLIYILLGTGLVIVGILMKVYSEVIDKEDVQTLFDEFTFNGNLRFGLVVRSLYIYVIVIGGCVVIMALIFTFGRCCRRRCMLVAYALIVILFLATHMVALGVFTTVSDRLENRIKGELETALTKYNGTESTTSVSVGWDLVFLGFDCCGVEDVGTNNREEFKDSLWYVARGTKEIPVSCCTVATESTYKTTIDNSCTDGHYIAVNNEGCYTKFKDWLERFLTPMIILTSFLPVVEVLLIALSFIICRDVGKNQRIV